MHIKIFQNDYESAPETRFANWVNKAKPASWPKTNTRQGKITNKNKNSVKNQLKKNSWPTKYVSNKKRKRKAVENSTKTCLKKKNEEKGTPTIKYPCS